MAEFDVIVIGSGPGGYVAAIRAAQLGLKTACVEKNPALGGTCLNVGCIPSKTLLHTSEFFWHLTHEAKDQGIECEKPTVNFKKMMDRKQRVVKTFNEGIDLLFKKNRITSIIGEASFTSPITIQVTGGQSHSAKSFILATGSEPIALPFLPFDEKRILSSTGILALSQVPKRLAVIGAGVIGVELGSVYSRLGSQVTFIEFMDRICPIFDLAISKSFQEILTPQGLTFHLSSKVVKADITEKELTLYVEKKEGVSQEFKTDAVLVSIGRRPFTKGLNLEKIGITPDNKGFIPINNRFRTSQPHIYAIGDIVDGPMLAHKAMEEGVAAAEIIAGHNPVIEYMAIPSVVYTYPEVAVVGLSEEDAKNLNVPIKTGQFPFKINSRAKCTGEVEGYVKVIAHAETDLLLGMHIIGAHASEMIAEGVLAIQKKVKVLDIALSCQAHPTLSESIKEACLAVHKRTIHR